jgi:excinuclease ABC subunit A
MKKSDQALVIRGAREHNLKKYKLGIATWIKLIVITGLSGSGKSTLAFDTIYAKASAVM